MWNNQGTTRPTTVRDSECQGSHHPTSHHGGSRRLESSRTATNSHPSFSYSVQRGTVTSRRVRRETNTQKQKTMDPELLTRTSWVDAKTAYRQVKKGKASGNTCALLLRWHLQTHLYNLGCFIQLHCGKVLFLGLLLLSLCCIGLKTASIETNVERLWVEAGGRLEKEIAYTTKVLGEGSGITNEIVIQTPKTGNNILNVDNLLLHYEALRAATKIEVQMFGEEWKFNDLCYKTSFPRFDGSMFERMLETITPCMIITPLDCFWEGSKLLGPEYGLFVPGYAPNVKWTNLDPLDLIESISKPGANLLQGVDGQFKELLAKAGVTTGYQEKPCLNVSDPECPGRAPNRQNTNKTVYLGEELTGGCSGFAAKYMKWEEELILGGVIRNKAGQIVRAEALQSIVLLMGEQGVYDFHQGTIRVLQTDWSLEKAKQVLEAWQRKFTQEIRRVVAQHNASTASDVHPFSSASLLDLLHEFSQISVVRVALGYVLMLFYACISLMKLTDQIQSQSGVGVAGVILVALSVAAGLGICSVIGIRFNASTTQIIPFLALGLGVDDMFLIAHTFAENAQKGTISYNEQTGECLKCVGVSVLLTSLSNMCAFFMAAVIPIPALKAFCLQAGILVLFNMVTVLLVFPAVVSLDLIRREESRVDVFCCFTGSSPKPNETPVVELQPRQRTPPPDYYEATQPGAAPVQWATPSERAPPGMERGHHQAVARTEADGSRPTTVLAPDYSPNYHVSPASSLPSLAASSHQCLTPEDGLTCRERCAQSQRECCSWSLTKFARHVYGPMLEKTPAKVIVIVCFTLLLVLGIVGTVKVKDGLDITDVVPRSTNEYKFLAAQSKYFGFYNFFAVTMDDFDYAGNQKLLHDYHKAYITVDKIIKKEDGSLPDYWLQLLRNWLIGIQEAFDRDLSRGCFTKERWYRNASDDGILGYKLMLQTGDIDTPSDRERIFNGRLVDREGIIFQDAFYNYVSAWASNDALAYAASNADFHPLPKDWTHLPDDYDEKVHKSLPFVFTQLPFYLHDMSDTEAITATIQEIRTICDTFEARGLPNYPRGIPFTFWEQYIHLRFYLMLALTCVLAAIFMVLTVVLMNPWAAFVVVVSLGMMVVELFGFMGLMGIKMSAVPAVVLIVSVGIGVEFTVHIVLGFITSIGPRNTRMRLALEHMFAPVIHGAMTTLLGVIMLASAEFDFIFRYFFIELTALVVLGMLNGLILLPVLLSLIGPGPEIVPGDPDAIAIDPPTPEPSPPPRPRTSRALSRRVFPQSAPSELSLTTITEEPTQYSSQDSTISVCVHPEVHVETSLPGAATTVSQGNNNSSSNSSRNTSPPESNTSTPQNHNRHHVATVKATTRVKVQLHAPLPGAVSSDHTSQNYKRRKRKCKEIEIVSSDSESESSSKS